MRNAAYGHWTEEETNWSETDTAFIDHIIKKKNKSITTSFEEIKAVHESLPY